MPLFFAIADGVLADKDSACLAIVTLAQALADHSKAGKAIFPKSNYLFDRGAVSQPTDVTTQYMNIDTQGVETWKRY